MNRILVAFCALAALSMAGCPEEMPGPDDTVDSTTNGRSFALGLEAVTYQIDGLQKWRIDLDVVNRLSDESEGEGASSGKVDPVLAEMVVVPVYKLGVPWTEFASAEAPENLPGAWVQQVQLLRGELETLGLPFLL